jgi:hypothetical protein
MERRASFRAPLLKVAQLLINALTGQVETSTHLSDNPTYQDLAKVNAARIWQTKALTELASWQMAGNGKR